MTKRDAIVCFNYINRLFGIRFAVGPNELLSRHGYYKFSYFYPVFGR